MHPYVHSSTIHKSQNMKQPECPSADDWIRCGVCVCVCVCVCVYVCVYTLTQTQ